MKPEPPRLTTVIDTRAATPLPESISLGGQPVPIDTMRLAGVQRGDAIPTVRVLFASRRDQMLPVDTQTTGAPNVIELRPVVGNRVRRRISQIREPMGLYVLAAKAE